MSTLNIQDSLILIIDIQDKLIKAAFNQASIEKAASILAKTSKVLNIPVIITEQYPKGLGETIPAIKENIGENTLYFEKTAFSALDNIEIKNAIEQAGKKQIVIFGIETHICVNQTANALKTLGYEVHVVKDACGSRAVSEYEAGLTRMKEHGIYQITTEIALFEWLKTARNPKFKEIQNLIK